ncbi:MFS transporter [Corynebacterium sp.]|uniref:MFS transporter n=1 Tax=Corynebacterium sp. TaxID=1720 RepID=UPI002A916593|nr:MFS transporter [Corynebacterium sp.]MDY5785840.1 MFS transporter [Corynebacterium sp.]
MSDPHPPPLPHQDANARRFIWSNGMQGIGDQIVAAKSVLPWLFTAAGVPAVFTAFLVPIRESGSMLPQAALSPRISAHPNRKRIWLLGSIGQGIAAAGIALAAAWLTGVALGVAVVFLLALLSVFRAVCSITGKDVQGRTIRKGQRGLITGRATALSGFFTLAIGLGLSFLPAQLPHWAIVALLAGGAATWFVATAVFARIQEPPGGHTVETFDAGWLRATIDLVRDDKELRQFLIVRSLMLVTSLSTPFIVVLAQQEGQDLTGLGAFVIASGGAALIGGRISGVWSDRSSKNAMGVGAGVAAAVLVVLVACAQWASPSVNAWVMPAGYFLVNLAHTTVRVARKTYLVDMADGARRTMITGASNTVMGVVLLVMGAVSSLIAIIGPEAVLLFLAVVGVVGVVGAGRLKDVSHRGG